MLYRKISITEVLCFFKTCYHQNYRTLHEVVLESLPPHKLLWLFCWYY